jgi:hypothetical protein
VASVQLSPGVVIDTDRGQAYVMHPEGGIVAVGLAAGNDLWRSQEAAKPLTAAKDVLVAQAEAPGPANELKIVTLDTKGQPVAQSLVQLPPNVHPMIAQTAHRSFTAHAVPDAGAATVSWEFREQPLRGVPPGPLQVLPGEAPPAVSATAEVPGPAAAAAAVAPAVVEPGAPAVMRGAVRIDLSSGAVAPAIPPHLSAPAAAAPAGHPGPDLPADASLPHVPKPQFLSADQRYVMSSQRIADDPEWDKYLWTIYQRDTGARVGEFRTHLRYAPFSVTDHRAIYQTPPYARREETGLVENPPQIHAVDLATGARLWSHPVRDTVDRRPRPP